MAFVVEPVLAVTSLTPAVASLPYPSFTKRIRVIKGQRESESKSRKHHYAHLLPSLRRQKSQLVSNDAGRDTTHDQSPGSASAMGSS
jgi:hypothetical protein